ncbi:unnamed protein product [Rangifer tarandus platyrhynchus]|uniref:Uncharacterized protein n=1 Tax=Rangifer tarandus platyrhynchus TaxID=3082113 RepID=A0ABN8XU65_RANTA|nr:unnamed protein product [Rangifer tarandus platyrhynchus]
MQAKGNSGRVVSTEARGLRSGKTDKGAGSRTAAGPRLVRAGQPFPLWKLLSCPSCLNSRASAAAHLLTDLTTGLNLGHKA